MRIGPLSFFLVLMVSVAIPVFAFDYHHANPQTDSQVPISGWPYYIENITVGSPVSDYGSHSGIKASVDDDYAIENSMHVPAKTLLNSAHYAAYTDLSGQIDQFFVRLIDKEETDLAANYERTIEFFPWGFVESGESPFLRFSGRVLTAGLDRFSYCLTVQNISDQNLTFSPQLVFQRDGDRRDESLNIIPIRARYNVSIDAPTNTALVQVKGTDIWRSLKATFVLDSFEKEFSAKRTFAKGETISLTPGQEASLSWTIAFARSKEDALANAETPDPCDNIWATAYDKWQSVFDSLPRIHASGEDYEQLARLATTGLAMDLYAPRNEMSLWGSVPSKAHFTSFWGWDTAFQAMGQAYFDTATAKENLALIFSGPEERVFLELADDLLPAFTPLYSQPPVTGWAIWDVFVKDGAWDTNWLENQYQSSKGYLDWWEMEKDIDGDGLCEFTRGLEVGWDDNPRYHCNLPVSLCIKKMDYIDSITLNGWLAAYFLAMEKMASVVAPKEAEGWRQKAFSMGDRIEQLFWDEAFGAYFDREYDGTEHRLHHVLTPAIAWPLFVGVARDPERIPRVVEQYLLNNEAFWGEDEQMPFPTVAYNDLAYDEAQDGYYWEGQVWLITSYAMIKALYRYGYEEKARQAAQRTLDFIISNDTGGIYEAYDAKTGRTGFGTNGRLLGAPGEPAAFQFGWSCTFVLEMLFERYQRERFVMPDDTVLTGHLVRAEELITGDPFFFLDESTLFPPFVSISCDDKMPLIDQCQQFSVRFEDPWESVTDNPFLARFPLILDADIYFTPDDGDPVEVSAEETEAGIAFFATMETPGFYSIVLPEEPNFEDKETESDKTNDSCCG